MPRDGLNMPHWHTSIMHLGERRAPKAMGTHPLQPDPIASQSKNLVRASFMDVSTTMPGSSGFCGLLYSRSSPIHGRSNQQVMKPVIVILESIQVLKGRRASRMIELGSATIGMKVPQQCHGS